MYIFNPIYPRVLVMQILRVQIKVIKNFITLAFVQLNGFGQLSSMFFLSRVFAKTVVCVRYFMKLFSFCFH